jgi:hypothetical protein
LQNEKDLKLRKFGGKNQTEFMKSDGKRNNKAMNVLKKIKKERKNKSWAKKIKSPTRQRVV